VYVDFYEFFNGASKFTKYATSWKGYNTVIDSVKKSVTNINN